MPEVEDTVAPGLDEATLLCAAWEGKIREAELAESVAQRVVDEMSQRIATVRAARERVALALAMCRKRLRADLDLLRRPAASLARN